MKSVTLVADYEVADAMVELTVLVGDAQIGTSIIKLASTPLGDGVIADLPIGVGSEIRGKKLFVKSIVTDVNDSTNNTSITYQLKGGRLDQEFSSAGTVDENGDSIVYRARFNLV